MSVLSTTLSLASTLTPEPSTKAALKAASIGLSLAEDLSELRIKSRSPAGAEAGKGEAEWEAYYGGYWRDIHDGYFEDISKEGNVFTRCIRWDGKGYRSYRNDRGLIIRPKQRGAVEFLGKALETAADIINIYSLFTPSPTTVDADDIIKPKYTIVDNVDRGIPFNKAPKFIQATANTSEQTRVALQNLRASRSLTVGSPRVDIRSLGSAPRTEPILESKLDSLKELGKTINKNRRLGL